jgi:uncharacterized glyoxalase superfamily protein PhnB
MNPTGLTPILNVRNVAASIAWFEKLGWVRGFAWGDDGMIAEGGDLGGASFAAVCAGECEIFLCQDGQGGRDELGFVVPLDGSDEAVGSGVWLSLFLGTPAEVDAVHALAVANGVTVTAPPTDEPWGVREMRIRHPDGHTFRVGAPIGA